MANTKDKNDEFFILGNNFEDEKIIIEIDKVNDKHICKVCNIDLN